MIEHQSAQKFALTDTRNNVLVDCVGNGLKDAILRGDEDLSEMGLQMPPKVTIDIYWKKHQNKSLVDLY